MHKSGMKKNDVIYDGYLVYNKSSGKSIIYQMSLPHMEDKSDAMIAGEEYINDYYPECTFEGLSFKYKKIMLYDKASHEKVFKNGWDFKIINII